LSLDPDCKLSKVYHPIADLVLHCKTVPTVLDAKCATQNKVLYNIVRAAAIDVLPDVRKAVQFVVKEVSADRAPPMVLGKTFFDSGSAKSNVTVVKALKSVGVSCDDVMDHPTHTGFGSDGTSPNTF